MKISELKKLLDDVLGHEGDVEVFIQYSDKRTSPVIHIERSHVQTEREGGKRRLVLVGDLLKATKRAVAR
jgi:hypothetical protein